MRADGGRDSERPRRFPRCPQGCALDAAVRAAAERIAIRGCVLHVLIRASHLRSRTLLRASPNSHADAPASTRRRRGAAARVACVPRVCAHPQWTFSVSALGTHPKVVLPAAALGAPRATPEFSRRYTRFHAQTAARVSGVPCGRAARPCRRPPSAKFLWKSSPGRSIIVVTGAPRGAPAP